MRSSLETDKLIEDPLSDHHFDEPSSKEPKLCTTTKTKPKHLFSIFLEPFQWLQMLSSQLNTSFLFGVLLVYGFNQGFAGSLFKVYIHQILFHWMKHLMNLHRDLDFKSAGSLRLLLERRPESAAVVRTTLHRPLLHPLGDEANLGLTDRRFPGERIPPEAVLCIRRTSGSSLRGCGCGVWSADRDGAAVPDWAERRSGDSRCDNRCVHCKEQYRNGVTRAGHAVSVRVLLVGRSFTWLLH